MNRFFILSVGVAAGILPGTMRADWGSVRSNNRSREVHKEVEHRVEEEQRAKAEAERRRHEESIRLDHHVDRDLEIGHGHFWSSFFAGMVVHGLPVGYRSIAVRGHPYYYYDGVYYEPSPSGYAVIVPPVGAVVPGLPSGAVGVVANGLTYFYAGGAYYTFSNGAYVVVPAPIGISVASLPPGAVPVVMNGNTYYLAGGVYYFPIMQGGVTVYTTVNP